MGAPVRTDYLDFYSTFFRFYGEIAWRLDKRAMEQFYKLPPGIHLNSFR
ncbi:hypothetical protein J2Z49_002649 [Desulfofundulus luciae]|uniref:Uncharacterized protein n=1 Tax=Desulfofundulus luciae TaxID=74702 RepID=A0ABU0B470_9FIRM|nr:hypothetical protein [Desulfofundulus luciae]